MSKIFSSSYISKDVTTILYSTNWVSGQPKKNKYCTLSLRLKELQLTSSLQFFYDMLSFVKVTPLEIKNTDYSRHFDMAQTCCKRQWFYN